MIDPRLLRDEPDRIRAAQAKRGLSDEVVDRAVSADETRRAAIAEYERLRGEQKTLGKLIPKAAPEEKASLLEQTKELAGRVKAAEAAQTEAEDLWRTTLMEIPNLASDESPAGGEEDYRVIETVGTKPEFDFEPRDHVDLGRMLGAIDLERGAKVSGLALLLPHRHRRPARVRPDQHGDGPGPQRRLHADDRAVPGQAAGHGGYGLPGPGRRRRLPDRGPGPLPGRDVGGRRWRRTTPTRSSTPARCRCATPRSARASARRPARTARTPAASSACTGSTRSRCSSTRPSRSRTPSTCGCWSGRRSSSTSSSSTTASSTWRRATSGTSAQRKFDCEAWIASQGRYRELTSTSNCTDFQTRRLDTRGRFADGTVGPVATLNGTLCSTNRPIIALLETHQQADGSVRVPQALQPYLGGLDVIKPVA